MIETTRRIAAGAATVALLAGASAAAPGAAQAQSADRGSTTVALSAGALKALKAQGVTVTAVTPAKLRGGRLTLPVARGALATKRSWLEHEGGLTFRRRAGGKVRKVAFTDLRATLGASSANVSASVGDRRVSLFTVAKRTASVNAQAGTAGLAATKVTLTAKAATLVRKGLKLKRLSRALGSVSVDAALRGRTAGSTPTTPRPAAPGSTTPAPGTPGAPTPGNTELAPEPPVLARPQGAADVRDVKITWHIRDSWIRYLSGGDGPSDGTVPVAGVAEGAAIVRPGTAVPLVYDFAYSPAATASWETPGGAQVALYNAGALQFTYPAHTIDLVAKDPEIELDGAQSRAIFRFDGASVAAASRNRRTVLLRLDPTKVTPTVTGGTVTYERIPAYVAEGAQSGVFANFYLPGDEFGSVSVSYTR